MNGSAGSVRKRRSVVRVLKNRSGVARSDSGRSGAARSAAERSDVARSAAASRPKDRRVRRTDQSIIMAMVEQVLEKGYAAVTVQDLLDHADIGRSTFYAHYRGKDDLLLRSFERMLEAFDRAMPEDNTAAPRVAPVRELFRHVGEFRPFHRALARAHMIDRLYQVGTTTLSRTIALRIARQPSGAGDAAIPLPVLSQALAGALFALLRWWIDNDSPHTPEEMDEMFHSIRPGPMR